MILTSWPGLQTAGPEFVQAVVRGAHERGWDADGLLGHMSSESGLDPKAKNPHASASGLIQVTDATAKALGLRDAAQVQSMSREKQLKKVVFPFFEMMGGPYSSGADYKIAGFGKRPTIKDSSVVIEPQHVGINPGFAVDPATGAVLAGAVRAWWNGWANQFAKAEFRAPSRGSKSSGFDLALALVFMAAGAAAAAWKATR